MYTLLSVPWKISDLLSYGGAAWRCWGWGCWRSTWRTGGDAGIGFHPYAEWRVGDESSYPGAVDMAIGEWVARSRAVARQLSCAGVYGGSLLSAAKDAWAKGGNNFVYIERVKGDEGLAGAWYLRFQRQRRLQSVRYAASAKFDPEHKVWRLSQVDESDLQSRNRSPVRRR